MESGADFVLAEEDEPPSVLGVHGERCLSFDQAKGAPLYAVGFHN